MAEPDAAAPPERGPAAYVAEFIGTFALTFFICSAVCIFVSARISDFVVIGLVHAFALFFLIQTLAVVSGAHFNPAVTVALAATRQIRPPDAVIYVVAQLAGGVAAALLVRALFTEFPNAETQNYGAPAISDRLGEKVGPRHAGRVHRHLLPGVGDRRRGGEPARATRTGRRSPSASRSASGRSCSRRSPAPG